MRLSNKVAVVTGASKGIGAGIAQALAAEGASVVVNYASSRDAAQKVVAGIVEDGGKAVAVQGDVSKADEAQGIAEAAVREFGGLDVLVNNSGVYEFADLAGITEASFRRVFDIDVLGLILVTKEAVARMNDGGCVINISSLASTLNMPGSLVYSAAKHAVDGITYVLAKELAPRDIRVNGINPGLIETEGSRAAGFVGGAGDDSGFAADVDLGRPGTPQDIASIVTFLASGDSNWVTGQSIVANGVQVV
ncbi:SDR family NAD(P)-dependent oxidoreductase [Streptomyces sp. Ag109_G2-15]|uniref:SDR family NAD(P)-dependent oxidoreductase n=1 Tax=Streptomyces sp. Ag109_G2-15 TaxID=1938850 RepID=UPI000BD5EDD9|nr:glucose 1-dehydrogenase [Streptomyces sp. Ag109_G2-15]SOE07663.1 glucose 1-dehydrogenase [Streptomyces sp. Ag109_G2-15]